MNNSVPLSGANMHHWLLITIGAFAGLFLLCVAGLTLLVFSCVWGQNRVSASRIDVSPTSQSSTLRPAPASPISTPESTENISSFASGSLYPPNGYVMETGFGPMRIGAPTESPDGEFRIEQWRGAKPTHLGTLSWQTWLVSKTGEKVRLPEAAVPKDYSFLVDTGSTGYSSYFSVSGDGKYIFRCGKIAHAIGGAYLYRRTKGLNFELLVPDLGIQACNFFTQSTGFKWKYGMGIVELAAWQMNDNLLLKVRGSLVTAGVMGWQCAYSPESGHFSIDDNSLASNEASIHQD